MSVEGASLAMNIIMMIALSITTFQASKKTLKNISLNRELDQLTLKYNTLVKLINRRGGREFLDNGKIHKPQLTNKEINSIIKLCHPDKHGGSQLASEITIKLLEIRGK